MDLACSKLGWALLEWMLGARPSVCRAGGCSATGWGGGLPQDRTHVCVGSVDEESACNAGDTGDLGSTPGVDPLEKEVATHSSILA